MSTIGLQIDVDYNGQAAFRQVQGDVDRVAQAMRTKGSAAAGVFRDATGRLRSEMGRYVGEAGRASKATQTFSSNASGALLPLKSLISAAAAYAAVRLGETIFSQAERTRGLGLAFEAAAGGVQQGAAEMEFARQQAERLGIDLDVVAGSYKGIVAAAMASGKGVEFAREVFLGMSEAGRAMGLSNQEIEGSLMAVQQIISKGTVSAEELRQQLGERFPVAVGMMAKALGVTTAELSEMMEQGQVTSDALLPFARKLREEYGSKLAGAIAMPGAELNRLGNDAKELATAIGEGGLSEAVKIVATSLRTLFDEAQKSNLGEKIGGAMKLIAQEFATFISTYGPGMVRVIGTIATGLKDNFTPALLAARDTVKMIVAGFQMLVGGVLSGAAQMVGALKWIIEQSAKVSEALGFKDHAEQLRHLNTSLTQTQDKLKAMGEEAFQSSEKWYASAQQVHAAQEKTTQTVKLTAAEVRKLGDDALVMNGKVVDAGRKVTESVEGWKERLVKINGVWTSIGGSAQQASNTVQSSMSSASKSTESSFKKIETDGKSSAKGVEDAFDKTGKGMVGSMKRAADEIEQQYDRIANRAKEIDDIQKNSLMNQKMAPINTDFASDLPGLQEQLRDAVRAKADVWRVGAGTKGYYDYANREYDKIIAELERRIATLQEQETGSRDDSQRLMSSGAGSSSSSSSTSSGGGSRSGSGGGGRGGTIGGLGTTTLPPPGGTGSLVLGKDGGGGVHINNPQFVVDIRGVDEQMLNSRNLVQQLLPELRRAVAQGELENTSR